MKKRMTTAVLNLILSSAFSQINMWTWIKGSPGYNAPVIYGIKTISDASNDPGGRETPVTFTDHNGNLWLFGGLKANGKGNDLWKYSTGTNEWCWMSGDSTDNNYGSYGIKGAASAANQPGARNQSTGWTDARGDLWLFGGFGYAAHSYGYLNDLWKYEISSHQWIWVSGDSVSYQYACYGTKGLASSTGKPGARYNAMSCSDNTGNLWLFGGTGKTGSSQGLLNDLWKFNTVTGQWTWISGDNTSASAGCYGTKGLSQPLNRPCARNAGKCMMDAMGAIWLFGGYSANGAMNDLWKYSVASGEWTWVSGDNTASQSGIYGTQGVAAAANGPGARSDFGGWMDQNTIWIFGGYGEATSAHGSLNDLWKFDAGSGLWTWMKGDSLMDQPGFYGTMGVPLAVNKPTSKKYVATWTDGLGNLWLFGGGADDSYQNDLWTYSIHPAAVVTEYSVRNEYVLFPNPNNGSFSIRQPDIRSVTIYDLNGKQVFTDRSGSGDIRHLLEAGLYMVEICSEKTRTVQKMTVVK
ncbi:MAG: Kelch repeat-containing protein [Bacteroidia bacterium]